MDPIFLFIGSKYDITCLYMKAQDLYSGDIDGTIVLWNFDSRRPKVSVSAHSKSVLNIQYLRTNNTIVSQGRDGLIKFWVIIDNIFKEISRFETSEYTFCKLTIYIDMKLNLERICHVLGDEDNNIEIIEYPNDVVTHQFTALPPISSSIQTYGFVMALCFVDRDVIAAGYEAGHVIIFENGLVSSCLQVASSITSIASSSKNVIVVGTAEDQLIILQMYLNPNSLTVVYRINLTNHGIGCVTWRDDDRIFATGGWDGFIRVFSGKTFKQLTVLKWDITNKASQLCLYFSDEHYLVSGSDDKVICVWDIYR